MVRPEMPDQKKHAQIRTPKPFSVSSEQEQVEDTAVEDALTAREVADSGRFGAH